MESELSETVDEVVGYLRDSVSVNLIGLRHSGRSHIARRATERLRQSGRVAVVVHGVAALRDQPLAGLAVTGVKVAPGVAASTISSAVDALANLLPPRRSVLVIDDADDLDLASCGAIVAAHLRQPFPVLSVTRPQGRRQSVSRSLTAGLQPGVRVVLNPLDFDQLNRVIHRLLPGPVESSTIARIVTLSGGLPGLVGTIVDTGRRAGVLVEDRGLWRADGDLWNVRLAQAAESLLADVTEEELDALTALAAVGTVGLAEAHQIVPDRSLARLDELGLVRSADTPVGPLAGVFPPLVAEHLRRAAAAPRRAGPDGGEGRPSGAATAAAIPLTDSHAALLNLRLLEHWQAQVDVLLPAWRVEPSAEHAVALLAALDCAAIDAAEFATVIAGTSLEGADPRWRAGFVVWQAAFAALALDDLDGACSLLRDERRALPAFASHLRATEVALRLLAGSVPEPALLAPGDLGEDPICRESVEGTRIARALVTGQTGDALAALPGYSPTSPFLTGRRRVALGLARVLHGDFDAGVELALTALAEAMTRLDLSEIHAHAYVAALGLTFAGRLDDLDRLLGPILTLSGTTLLHGHYQVGLLELASLAAARRGQRDYARSLAVQAEAIGRRPGPLPGMLHGVTEIPADPHEDLGHAASRLWRAVEERLGKGFVAAGVTLAVTAVEIGVDAAGAALAVESAGVAQSPFLRALGRYVGAAAAADPGALADCAAELWSLGARLHALKATITQSLVLRAQGDAAASAGRAREAWERSAPLGEARRGLFFRLGRAIGLSPREQEIVTALADGATGPAIAASLGLSARTVENYLFSSCRKLGCDGRDELVRAVTTWAALSV